MSLFSIILPVYNKADTLPRAIGSVLEQTDGDWELIVVDDGSTDGFEQAVRPFLQDTRMDVIRQPNAGVSAARNAGIARARGQYLCFLDADDAYLPDHLALYRRMMQERPGAGAYVTGVRSVLPNGSIEENASLFLQPGTFWVEHFFEYTDQIGGRVVMGTLSACVDRRALARAGLFEPGEKVGEDTDFFFRVGAYAPIVLNGTVTSVYHREASTATRDGFFNENWYFQYRRAALLNDPHISPVNKRYLRRYLLRFGIHKARHLLLEGKRRQAVQALRSLGHDPDLRWRRLSTWALLLVPTPVLRAAYLSRR